MMAKREKNKLSNPTGLEILNYIKIYYERRTPLYLYGIAATVAILVSALFVFLFNRQSPH